MQLDEDEYSGEFGATGGDSGDSGGAGAGDGDGDGDVVSGGGSTSGGGSIGPGGDGGNSGGGGTGGSPVDLPAPWHYYPLDGDFLDAGRGPDLPHASASTGNFVQGAISGTAWEISTGNWLQLEPRITEDSPFTISWWFAMNPDLATTYFTLISKVIHDSEEGGYALFSDQYYVNARLGSGSSTDDFGSPDQHTNDGTWNHLVLVLEEFVSGQQDYFAVWLNGQPIIERAESIPDVLNSIAYVRFGTQESSGWFQGFAGSIDEIRVYDERLSPEQIELLYEMDKPK